MARTIAWWSTGAASAVMAHMALQDTPEAIIARCETNNEDPDNYRFEADVMRRLNRSVTLLKSENYESVPDVWRGERYMAGNEGAPCTREMKIMPRLAFQRPTDIHVFGYTADARDAERFKTLQNNYPELIVKAPLIERGVTKAATLALVERWGIELPRSYAMGFPNANCLQTGCVKATSPDYWSLYRQQFPDNFARTAAYAREIGARLTRIKGERIFIDEIPADWPTTNPIAPACDFLCHLAAHELEAAE
jgi:3'-phosphoadenosine 5'-phosphosulfate sulfotransferase (PAPS reductase)/FAD synthetase